MSANPERLQADSYSVMTAEELRRWAENELEISGDDERSGGEVVVARTVLALIRRLSHLEAWPLP